MVAFLQDLQIGLHQSMEADPTVYLFGEDILDPYGGAFKVSKGLSTRFPDRVITTPISEAGIVGLANGMALRGLKPVVEIMFGDFITLIADQLVNYASKFNAMYHQTSGVPIVIRVPVGAGRGYGPTHSQSLEKLFLGIPYLKIIAPSHFHSPGKSLQQAILRDNNPIVFLENKLLYTTTLHLEDSSNDRIESIPEDGYQTKIIRNFDSGPSDLTVITYGGGSLLIDPLLSKLRKEEIRITVCIPEQIKPFPIDVLTRAARESGRVLILEEGTEKYGWASELTTQLHQRLWNQLAKPIERLASLDTVIPAARPLEQLYLPTIEKIEQKIYEVLI